MNSESEEHASEFEEEGMDMVAEEDKEDMTGTSEFTAEHNVETEEAVGKNWEMVIADVARNVSTEDVSSENNSVSTI